MADKERSQKATRDQRESTGVIERSKEGHLTGAHPETETGQ